jgi:hypothetical protein
MASPSSVNPNTFAWSYGTIVTITNANGVTGNTIVDVTATPTQTTVNNNFRVLSDKVNAIIAVLKSNGTLT